MGEGEGEKERERKGEEVEQKKRREVIYVVSRLLVSFKPMGPFLVRFGGERDVISPAIALSVNV